MGKTLYLECSSGISGDMAVAALLDLGADENVLRKALESLPADGFSIEISRVKKSGLDACDFLVLLDEEHENHDHDMEYLHGAGRHEHGEERHEPGHHHSHEEECHAYGHSHEEKHHHGHGEEQHEHGHSHEEECHEHGHSHHSHEPEHHHAHPHVHRGLKDVISIISQADLTPGAGKTAERIFTILADAEAKAHGVPLDEVHFHEVGAVDSIVDIVAAAVCLDDLDITEVIVPGICEGRGFVRCQHGVIPVPVPAVANIAQAYGLSLHLTETEGELVTPTGAAIVAAVKTSDSLPESFIIQKIGMGAGKRTYERPSLLRAMLIDGKAGREGEADSGKNGESRDTIYHLETNIDDCTGENLGYVMKKLFKAGARDVNYTPVYMKKNRPAYQLNVICDKESVPRMENIIFRETTTIGIRRMEMERTVLKRHVVKVKTSLGEAEVKVCILPDGERRYYPEYASVRHLADKNKISYQETLETIKREAAGQ